MLLKYNFFFLQKILFYLLYTLKSKKKRRRRKHRAHKYTHTLNHQQPKQKNL
jgi:hypothetical protein